MKFKKVLTCVLIGLCAISFAVLGAVIFCGCSSENFQQTLSTYNIEIDFDDQQKTLACNEKLTYKNNTETSLFFVCLHLYPNAFRENSKASVVSLADQSKAYPNGLSFGEIQIENVNVLHNTATCCNSLGIAQPTYSEVTQFCRNNSLENNEFFIGGQDENILYVIMKNELFPGDEVEIEIEFNVVLPNINHRFGYGQNTVNLANFYPIACVFENGDFNKALYNSNGDPFYSDMANYNVKLTAPNSFVVSNSGSVLSATTFENSQTLCMQANIVRDFAIVLSTNFKQLSKTVGDTQVKYYYFSDETPENSLAASCDALEFFSSYIGDYPYSTLSVVEADFVHGGMEFPNLVYISTDTANTDFYTQVIVHEIAHQWWYNMVGSSAFDHGWLDEGLTEYSTALFFKNNPSYGVSKDVLISNAYSSYSIFVSVYEKAFGKVDTSMDKALDEFETSQEYTYMAYVKGMLLFDSLREIMGENKFQKCLQQYFENNKFKNVTPEDMIASFEKTSGRDLEGYFDAWINGKVILLK